MVNLMFNPAYKITLGNKVINTTDEPQASTVIDLLVELDIDTPADRFLLTLGNVGSLQPETEDEAAIELGYADDGELQQVMAGTLVKIKTGLLNTQITGQSAVRSLLFKFISKTYESKSAGDIVRDLAGEGSVRVASADSGIRFPAYVIDERKNLYRHMLDLAELCGFDLYANENDELVFKKFTSGNQIHLLDYGKDILELEIQETLPPAGKVEVFGESPGGGQSPEAWAWLTKDFGGQKGTAGSGSQTMLVETPVLRSNEAARTTARAISTAITRNTRRGRLLIAGRPQVKLGDAVRLREVPNADLNGTYQVRSVTHRVSKQGGFTTTIEFRSI
ncbi:MAG: hypothetical protein Kow0042_16710 [Calditrichia bacterium]